MDFIDFFKHELSVDKSESVFELLLSKIFSWGSSSWGYQNEVRKPFDAISTPVLVSKLF